MTLLSSLIEKNVEGRKEFEGTSHPSLPKVSKFRRCQAFEIFNLREFIVKNYQSIKTANPNLPILIRESGGVEAIAYYRFGKFKEFYGRKRCREIYSP